MVKKFRDFYGVYLEAMELIKEELARKAKTDAYSTCIDMIRTMTSVAFVETLAIWYDFYEVGKINLKTHQSSSLSRLDIIKTKIELPQRFLELQRSYKCKAFTDLRNSFKPNPQDSKSKI